MDIKKLPLITDLKTFNGGSWYREGKYLVVMREVGSKALPPGFEVDVNCSLSYVIQDRYRERAYYIVDGWKLDAKIVSRPSSNLLQVAKGRIVGHDYGLGRVTSTKASFTVEAAMSGYVRVNVVFYFKKPVTGVAHINLILNGTWTLYTHHEVLSEHLSCGASFITDVQNFDVADVLSVELNNLDLKNSEDVRVESLELSILNLDMPASDSAYFKIPEEKQVIAADLTIGDVKLSLEYPADKSVDFSAIIKALRGNK